MDKAKSFDIPKRLIWEAYRKVARNKGAAGVDEVSIKEFNEDLRNNLYKLWNRLASGSYFPPPVKLVEIPKKDGGKRPLGIPTVADRIAQTAVALYLEPLLDPSFDEDSYGYRPMKSALQAVERARQRCWRYSWVLDLDIKGFFDNLDHELIMRGLERHTQCRWALFYVKRWLGTKVQQADNTLKERVQGTPQGGVVSPLLANIFLHYAFDRWMRLRHPTILFERYADDIVVHCNTLSQAKYLKQEVEKRLEKCKLELNQEKTQIVYCGSGKSEYSRRSFDFLGYTFRNRLAQSNDGRQFVGFLPAISAQAKREITRKIKGWRIHMRTNKTIRELAKWINPFLRGLINYYGQFYRSEMQSSMLQVEYYLKRWARRKFRKNTGITGIKRALRYLGQVRRYTPHLFEHWRYGWGSPIE